MFLFLLSHMRNAIASYVVVLQWVIFHDIDY